MTIFIKTELKKADDQTDIDKYSVAANNTEYLLYVIKINLPYKHYNKIHDDKTIISC